MKKNNLGEYHQVVNYNEAKVLREAMQKMGKRTLEFPNKRGVFVDKSSIGGHGALYSYEGPYRPKWNQVTEILGNQNWLAERMYKDTGESYHRAIGNNFAQIIVYDVLPALPVVFTDEIAANSYAWGMDDQRRNDFIEGLYQACKACGMALPAGDSSALKYLVNALPPVESAPVLVGSIVGIYAPPERIITGENLQPGDHIVAVPSSGIHMNGHSLVIGRGSTLKDQFLHKLPNGHTLGEEALIPAASYVNLVEAWMESEVKIHALLAGTGGGLSKIAFDNREYTYCINDWFTEIPPLFQFMHDLGVSFDDVVTTFNMGAGYYAFVPADNVEHVIDVGKAAGYELLDVGVVEKGNRKVVIAEGLVFNNKEPIALSPPGD